MWGSSQDRQKTHGSGSDTGLFRVQTWALAFPTSTVWPLSPAQQLKKEAMRGAEKDLFNAATTGRETKTYVQ